MHGSVFHAARKEGRMNADDAREKTNKALLSRILDFVAIVAEEGDSELHLHREHCTDWVVDELRDRGFRVVVHTNEMIVKW
jgi:hypothetical protein